MKKILYELIYKKNQKRKLGVSFSEFNYAEIADPKLREIVAFQKFCETSAWNQAEYSGLFSPNFLLKVNLSESSVNDFINKNPGRQVYLFHPYPYELKIQNNFLSLAELEHPGIKKSLELVWKIIFNEKLPDVALPKEESICCHCNYFIGSTKFWEGYSIFVRNFCNLLHSNDGRFLWHEVEYSLNPRNESALPMAVFVFERALTHYIKAFMEEKQIINYASYLKNGEVWMPRMLFPNENIIVEDLFQLVEEGMSKDIATMAYYRYRKCWSSL